MLAGRVRDVIGTVAPSLASALGGPLSGMAVRKIGGFLGVPDDDVAAIEQRLRAPAPEELAELQRLDGEFRQEMGALGVDLERIAAEDRANARAREVTREDWTPKVLAIAIIAAVIVFNGALYVMTPPDGNLAAIEGNNQLLEYLVIAVAAYYFGSSVGSKQKTAEMASRMMPPSSAPSHGFTVPGGLKVRTREGDGA